MRRIKVLEAMLLAADRPLSLDQLVKQMEATELPLNRSGVRELISELRDQYADHVLDLVEVASGYRFQVGESYARWLHPASEDRPAKYSRALLETLAIIAYRQPVTRADIEDIRGVAVSSQMVRTLQERHWIRVVGHKDVPGRPALLATTPQFLNDFNLRSLDQLPSLMDLGELDDPGVGKDQDLAELEAEAVAAGSRVESGEELGESPAPDSAGTEAATQASEEHESHSLPDRSRTSDTLH